MNEPGTPFLLFNYYDFLLLAVMIIGLAILKKKHLNFINKKLVIVFRIFFLFVFIPYLSIQIEINNVVVKNGIDDSFTLLYTLFKIPIWWLIGMILLFFISILDTREFVKE